MTRTHSKKLTIFFLAFTTLFTCMLHVCFYQGITQKIWQGNRLSNLYKNFTSTSSSFSTDYSSTLSSKLLRFRVLANSDSTKDQSDKKRLCAELIPILSPALSNVQTKEEAIFLVSESLPFLTAYCNDVLSDSDKSISCTVGPHLFPYKTYDDCQFPAGIYDTLLVTIGEGRGSNWWCLAFPPLCFADEAFLDVPNSSKQTLLRVLGADLFDEICVTEGDSKSNSNDLSKTVNETNDKDNDKRDEKKEQPKLTLGLFF